MSMSIEIEHGGGCCGIVHIFGFGNSPQTNDFSYPTARRRTKLEALDLLMETYIEEGYGPFDDSYSEDRKAHALFNAALEAVLTDGQMEEWAKELKKRGFKLVSRFYNSNSGNYCNVLYYTPHEPRGRNRPKPPYKW